MGYYLTDISIIIGFILLIFSFRSKYKKYRFTFITIGLVLLVSGFYFLDYQAIMDCYEAGRAAGESIGVPELTLSE